MGRIIKLTQEKCRIKYFSKRAFGAFRAVDKGLKKEYSYPVGITFGKDIHACFT